MKKLVLAALLTTFAFGAAAAEKNQLRRVRNLSAV
jgi:hypothetical protein